MKCDPLSDFNLGLGWALVAGVSLMFGPQYYLLWRRQSHLGISLGNLLCATFVSLLQLGSLLCSEWDDSFGCCNSDHTTRQCVAAMAPVAQMSLVELGYLVCIAQFVYCWDIQGLEAVGRDPDAEWAVVVRQLLCWAAASCLFLAVAAGLAGFGGGLENHSVETFGLVLTVIASALLATHWSLQMIETWRLQSPGSLSLPSLFVSSTGSALTMYSVFAHGGWAVAASYLASTVMMGATFILGVYLLYCSRRYSKLDAASRCGGDSDSEERGTHCSRTRTCSVKDPIYP
eukprot:TRINITY_DN20690_c0_g1_i1.p1 TRINITY_DN20690_c0_g1~~TRINITY_DN20690_c0_g1_i1.p1  ORF type:complete len:288 (+),score=78.10 TRINITY_DN20690_c0_g1_i1:123-986(+)